MSSAIPDNAARFTLAEVAAATSGALSAGVVDSEVVDGVVTDTRANVAGKLFVALTGERYDGHVYASAAIRGGARALLVERDLGDVGLPCVRVESTLEALGRLSAFHRRRWGGRLVAVAGSAGKTTTKSAVCAALDALAPGAVHFARGNLNNSIGVPLVLLGLTSAHRYAAVEIGTNAPGEVRALAAIARPDVAVLTTIGLEHTEGLGSLDQIELEEGSLYDALAPEGVAVGNTDDERVERQLARSAAAKLRYGFSPTADYRVTARAEGALGASRVALARPGRSGLEVEWPLLGRAGAYALAAAVAAAEACSSRELEAEALAGAARRLGVGEPGRLAPVVLADGAVVLDDTYNSNPASLRSSVAAASELARARRARLVLVLGEMRELGDDSPILHREAGDGLLDSGAELVIGVAGDARWFLEPFARKGVEALFVADVDGAERLLAERLSPGDVVLIKASRGVRAERIVEALIRARGRSA